MNSVKIKRGKSINVQKKDIQCIFSKSEYIHGRCILMRKLCIEYLVYINIYHYTCLDILIKLQRYIHTTYIRVIN